MNELSWKRGAFVLMKTKDRILNESIKLFAQNGFDGTSMASIAKQIGVTKPSLYAHYENKLALFEACLEKVSIEQVEFTNRILNNPHLKTAEEKLFTLLKDCTMAVSEKRYSFYSRFYFWAPVELEEIIKSKLETPTHMCNNLISDVISDAVDSGEIDKQYSKGEITSSFICLMDGLGCREESYHKFETIWKVFWSGIKA